MAAGDEYVDHHPSPHFPLTSNRDEYRPLISMCDLLCQIIRCTWLRENGVWLKFSGTRIPAFSQKIKTTRLEANKTERTLAIYVLVYTKHLRAGSWGQVGVHFEMIYLATLRLHLESEYWRFAIWLVSRLNCEIPATAGWRVQLWVWMKRAI